jgi:hypothetical protein
MIFLAAFAVAIDSTGRPPVTDLSGNWKGAFHVEKLPDAEANRYRAAAIHLSKDGKFTFHIESRVMVNIMEDDTGNYKFDGKTLRLIGTSKTLSDDGYKKETNKGTIDYKLKLANGKLALTDASFWTSKQLRTKIVFSRVPVSG